MEIWIKKRLLLKADNILIAGLICIYVCLFYFLDEANRYDDFY